MESKINFLYFDIYSKRASFFYNNQEKIGSYFGLFLTLIYIIISLTLFIYNLIITIQRKEFKIYETTLYNNEIPSIKIDSNNLYFAFGIENPDTLNRFVDETIYYPEILYIDKIKENGEFIAKTINLDYEICKIKNFGLNYPNLFLENELNNSYCLKDFNYSLTLNGGFKNEKMSYIRIKIYPCKNTTENNNHCKPKEIIDNYLSSTYLSILIRDLGLNPANYSFPFAPILIDLFTTIDKGLYRNFIINFGLSEIQTDNGLFNERISKKTYLHYKDYSQSFSFMKESDYLEGKEIGIIEIRLDDIKFIQKRTYTKISEIFSRMGGYMQLIHTSFSLLSLLINKFNSELKIINSIFNFSLQKRSMALKYQSLRDFDSINLPIYKKNLIFSSKKSVKNQNKQNTKNNKNIILMDSNISSIFNRTYNKKPDDLQSSKLEINRDNKNFPLFGSPEFDNKILRLNKKSSKFHNEIKNKTEEYSINYNGSVNNPSLNFPNNKKESNNNINEFNDKISLNILDYICQRNIDHKKTHFDLYNLGISFYKTTMDLIHVFTLLLITEKILLKRNK